MMNGPAWIALIAIVCLGAPIMAGFLMPNDEVDTVGYETTDPLDITNGLNNDVSDIPIEYRSYLNDLFMTSGSIGYWLPSGDYTTIPNNFPALSVLTTGYFGNQSTKDLSTMSSGYSTEFCIILYPQSTAEMYDSNGNRLYGVIYFMNTNLAYGLLFNNFISPIGTTISIVEVDGSDVIDYKYYQQTVTDGKKQYLDPSKGLYSVIPNSKWSNAQTNTKVSLIIDTTDVHLLAYSQSDTSNLTVTVGTTIDVTFDDNTVKTLGSPSTYTKLLIEFDAAESKTSVTGLFDVTEFTQSLDGHMGNTVSGDLDLDNIKVIRFQETNVRYYVTSTLVKADNVAVMNNVTLQPSAYYPGFTWAINLKALSTYGPTFNIQIERSGVTTTYSYDVENGKALEMPLGGSTKDVALGGVTLAVIPNENGTTYTLRINGERWEETSLDQNDTVSIFFDGVWKVNTTIMKIEPYSYKEFQWVPGTFNVSATTFCFFGMMAAGLMAVFLGVCAFRSEMSWGPMIVAVIAGAIYTILLVSYA